MDSKETCYFQALYDVVVAVNSSLEPQEVLKAVVGEAAAATGAKGCSILLLSPDRRELRHTVSYGLSDRFLAKGPVMVDLSMSESLEGRSVSVRDAVSDPRIQYGGQNRAEGVAAILSVPMRLKGEVIGVARLYSSTQKDFSPEETEFLEAVAHLGAIALTNAREHQELKTNLEMVTSYIYNDTWYGQTVAEQKK